MDKSAEKQENCEKTGKLSLPAVAAMDHQLQGIGARFSQRQIRLIHSDEVFIIHLNLL